MKVYQVGRITEQWINRDGEPELEFKEFVYDIVEEESPEFDSSYENWNDHIAFSYKLFETEKTAIDEFITLVDYVRNNYDKNDYPKYIPLYDELIKIAFDKYPELLV